MFEQYPPQLRRKLYASQLLAIGKAKRNVKCPVCGALLYKAVGREHQVVEALCRKCGFNEIIDLALFRTMRLNQVYNLEEGYWYCPHQEQLAG
ncbi:MAG: hypothetical protein IJI66_03860 [Erysipelotrichaceae bacterium]|nr:hypothetical protein [Erysipelotrichaceae bacterium]